VPTAGEISFVFPWSLLTTTTSLCLLEYACRLFILSIWNYKTLF